MSSRTIITVVALAATAAVVSGVGRGASASSSSSKRRRRRPKDRITPIPAWCKLAHKHTELGPEKLQEIIDATIAVDKTTPPWAGSNLAEARERAFQITMTTMGNLCPGIRTAPSQAALPQYVESMPPWWKGLYDLVQARAWHLTTSSA